ncbi:MAG TPA: hypothetical protein VFB96_12390 [Pirellulaceae bacterium]|nr:hypothetical protein [Pirellulaceae bacterium]
MNARWLLVWLLRLAGGITVLAYTSVVMPRGWMEAGHAALGMGEMPPGPLLDFMIRQASYVYGASGVLMILMSLDVVRYRPLILFTGISFLLAGPVFAIIDISASMPWFWTLADGIGCVAFGGGVLWLVLRDRAD